MPDAPSPKNLLAPFLGLLALGAAVAAALLWVKVADSNEARDVARRERAEAQAVADIAKRDTEQAQARRREIEEIAGLLADDATKMDALALAAAYFGKIPAGEVNDEVRMRRLGIAMARVKALSAAGKLDEAVAVARQRIQLGDELLASRTGEARREAEAVEARLFLAGLLERQGKVDEALKAAAEAREKTAAVRGRIDGEALHARVSRHTGFLSLRLGRLDEAEAAANDAMAVMQPIAEGRDAEMAETLRLAGEIARARKDDAKALGFHNRAIECDRRLGKAADAARFALSLSRVAGAHIALNEPDKAAPLIEEALPLLANPGGTDALEVQISIFSVAAELARAKGKLDEAIEFQRRLNEVEKALKPPAEPSQP